MRGRIRGWPFCGNFRRRLARTEAEIIGEHPEWLEYDLPPELLGVAWEGKYRGQRQKWFALRFLGADSDIRLDADAHPEFDAWKWVELAELPDLAVAFKRDIYEVIARDFAVYACHSLNLREKDMTMLKLTAADGHEFQCFEAGNVNAPRALVVVQEIFGVNPHMRAVSERLAGFGYRVLCPALFDRAEARRGTGLHAGGYAEGPGAAGADPRWQTLLDIEATAAAFGDKPVGIIGYCWGGSLAWLGATQDRAVQGGDRLVWRRHRRDRRI